MKRAVIFTVFLMMFQLVSGMVPVLGTGDSVAPVVNKVNIEPRKVSVGETITFSADVEDDISGVGTVYMTFASPTGNRNLLLSMNYNEESGSYEAKHKVEEVDEGGIWKLANIQVYDNVSNFRFTEQKILTKI